MKGSACVGLLLVLALGFPPGALAGPRESRVPRLFIRAEGGLLTVKATEIPHRRILEALAKQLGFELIVSGPLEERRSLELRGMPWEEALRKAIAPASWVFVYEPSLKRSLPVRVFVFPGQVQPASPVLASPPPAPAVPPWSGVPAGVAAEKRSSLAREQGEWVGAALERLVSAEDEETRAIALLSLAAIGGEQAVELLRQALKDDDEPSLREMMIELGHALENQKEE